VALRAGAAGLLKDAAVAELPLALRAVPAAITSAAPSRVVVTGFLAGMAASGSSSEPCRCAERTAARDLQLVVEGRSIKEIAFAAWLSVKTVGPIAASDGAVADLRHPRPVASAPATASSRR
jgi:DNA-binding NarL/FixJ family response regulator